MVERSAGARSCEGWPAAASAEWDNASALPPSSRDTGNRISFAGLRGCAETRDSDFCRAARNRACNPSHSTRFRGRLIRVPQVGRARPSLASVRRRAGRTPFAPEGASSAGRSRKSVSRSGASTARRRADSWQATSPIEGTRPGRSVICPGVTSDRRSEWRSAINARRRSLPGR